MTTRRKRNLLSSRRRVQDEGEDDDGMLDAGDDSQSDASELTMDDGPAADVSDLSDVEPSEERQSKPARLRENRPKASRRKRKGDNASSDSPLPPTTHSDANTPFQSTADVELMINGMRISENTKGEDTLHFEDTAGEAPSQVEPAAATIETYRSKPVVRPSAEPRHHTDPQEYKARMEADPSFVPNRGGFFMHDQRPDGARSAGFTTGRGRGRGKPLNANGYPPARVPAPFAQGSSVRWDHDLHQTVVEPKPTSSAVQPATNTLQPSTQARETRPISMSKSTAIGTVLVRVFLPNMAAPISIDKKLTVNQHTRLPDLRPPLRRDKPVRVSLPEHPVRYIFPSIQRSFIFIPRAQRPNQQRTRSRNRSYHPGSRRTSVFGGSNYSPSVAMSRRSSQAPDGIASPTGSLFARPLGAQTSSSRPVVKLPTGPQSQQGVSPSSAAAISGSGTPVIIYPTGSAYPLPSQPTYREHRSSLMTMHQPRPQKQVSVATIESPDQVSFQAPQQQEQQPFHQQVPVQYSAQQHQPPVEQGYYPQIGQVPVGYANGGTPLSNIPEGAINAQPFQPGLVPAQNYYGYPYQQPLYYFPAGPQGVEARPNQYSSSQVDSPAYMPQGQYFIPMLMPMPTAEDGSGAAQTGMYAHDSSGAIYYYDPSQLVDGGAAAAPQGPQPGMPEGYFQPQGAEVYYYGQQQQQQQ